MATTIQVSDSTLQMLKKLKESENCSTYDELISDILREKVEVKQSMFGILKENKLDYNKKEDRADVDEH